MTNESLQTLMVRTDDELWAILGAEISPGMAMRDPKFLRAAAKAWFDDQLKEFQIAVCGSPAISALRASGNGTLLVAAICDAIAPICGIPAATTASLLLSRYGLDRLCRMETEE